MKLEELKTSKKRLDELAKDRLKLEENSKLKINNSWYKAKTQIIAEV